MSARLVCAMFTIVALVGLRGRWVVPIRAVWEARIEDGEIFVSRSHIH